MKRISLILSVLFAIAASLPTVALAGDSDWIVSASEAKQLIEDKDALVLDTRGESAWKKSHVAGSQPVAWRDFSQSGEVHGGKLIASDATLTKRLQALGVSSSRPVLVAGNPPKNWGEDGRIVWMLRTLGHERASLVDGGVAALERAGVSMTDERADVERGDFEVSRTDAWSADRDEVKSKLDDGDVQLLDTRETREYRGKTPYGERRGGHVPGARHLHYTDLMDASGQLLPRSKQLEKLRAAGIVPERGVITYCTGGVRSAWLAVVLLDLGFDNVRNYAGSMWEWAAAPSDDYPLEKE
jgi:thiosulfate/3-mercaptopyruvate sulfurtransferase